MNMQPKRPLHIAIIGGGAAGYFAAIQAKRCAPSANITIFEKKSNHARQGCDNGRLQSASRVEYGLCCGGEHREMMVVATMKKKMKEVKKKM